MEFLTLSDFLQAELNRRKQSNHGYSLRAFSKKLNLSPSFVSKLMNGKRSVSEGTLLRIASALNIPEKQLSSIRASGEVVSENPEFATIRAEEFRLIADWHHFAILEATTLADFQDSPAWIAKRFSISESRAQEALDRLRKLDLISLDVNGKLGSPISNRTSVPSSHIAEANTEHERQVLQGALDALVKIPKSRRHQGSVTLAIPEARLDEAVKKIRNFRRELMASLQRPGKRDAVYQFSVSFYPLTIESNKPTNKEANK